MATRPWRVRAGWVGAFVATALVLLALVASTSAAANTQFRVLSASEQSIISGTREGCIHGNRQYDFSTSTPFEDPQSYYSEEEAFGSLVSASGDAAFSNDYVENICEPGQSCTYDFGTRAIHNREVGMYLENSADPTKLKVWTGPFATEFGSIEICDTVVNFPAGEPSVLVDKAQLLSGAPVDLTITGSMHFTQSNIGDAVDITVSYTIRMTVQALGGDLKISVGEAANEDQGGPSGTWNGSFPVSWQDTPCTDPPAGTNDPRAYVVAGANKSALASLLGTPEESLSGAAGFAGTNVKLTKAIGTVTPATAGWLGAMNTATKPKGISPGRGVFYGARIACKKPDSGAKFAVAKSDVLPLCHDRSSLSGTSWTGLKPGMRDALDRLWKILRPMHACYSPSSGFRSQDEQDKLRNKWHDIADHPKGDKRTDAQIHTALQSAGFAQDPAGYQSADSSGERVAKGGPALFSMHSLGVAADIHVEFSDTGVFEESLAKLQAAAAQAGLCGPPASDRVHVELPFVAGTDPVTHFPTVESVTATNGKEPKCSTFTDVKKPKPKVSAKRKGKSVKVTESSPVGSNVSVGGTASTPGASRVYKLKSVSRKARAGKKTKLTVKLPAAVRVRLGHGNVSVRLRVLVDYAGAKVVKRVALRL
jgi:hypothetical protein